MTFRNLCFAAAGFVLGMVATIGLFHRPSPPQPERAADVASVPEQPSFRVYLAGSLKKEGAVMIDSGEKVTVSQAIILDGGLADFGDERNVKLWRKQPGGTALLIPVDLKTAELGTSTDPDVQPGDLIDVPQRVANF